LSLLHDNKNSAFLILAWFVFFLTYPGQSAYSQVFPEVNTPASQQKQQDQENEKLAFQYYGDKDYEKALVLFRDLYEKQPTHHHYTYYLYCLTALNKFSEAEKLVRSKIKDEQGSYRYEVDLGYIYLLTDKPDKAAKCFDELIENMNPNKATITEIANAFLTRQLYEYAIKTYLRGRELLQYTENFSRELALVYEMSGNYSAMIEEYLDLLEGDPDQLEMVQNRFQNILDKDIDDKISDALRESLLKRNQRNPENRYYGEMLLWLSVQRKDFEFAFIQAKSLDTRFNEGGMLVFSIANLSLSNKDYDVAIEAFGYLLKKGPSSPYYSESLTGTLRAKFYRITEGYHYNIKDLQSLKEEYEAALNELGRNARSVLLMRDLAHLQAFYLNELDNAVQLLEEAININNVPEDLKAGIKLELGDIYLFVGEVWEASLLYSQVEKAFKNDPTGHEAKFRNARLSYFIGEFKWAKAQLDVLKAATTKFIANDAMELSLLISDNMDPDSSYAGLQLYSRADLLIYRGQDSLAMITLDSIKMLGLYHPLDDEVLYSKAGIYIREKDYLRADSVLDKIVRDYKDDILADNALFKRAELQAGVLNNKEKAMALYEQLLKDYPGSLFTTEARKRFRQLRGDFNN
jgi:outer membrane protein assembly factor BamD (BamD/ComL family)